MIIQFVKSGIGDQDSRLGRSMFETLGLKALHSKIEKELPRTSEE
jgi:hypothetical protein